VFRGVLFDLDDTLFDRRAALERWARSRLGADATEIAALVALDDEARLPRTAFAAEVLARFDLDGSREQLAESFPDQLACHVEPEPGIPDLLDALARTRRIAIVSNGGAKSQREKLRRADPGGAVTAVFISGEQGASKPDSTLFERALAWAELPAHECIFVGNDPELDLAPAMRLGLATCWRDRGRLRWPAGCAAPDFVARSVVELREVLA
jgi:putative hydrolase of the HAD superfamily